MILRWRLALGLLGGALVVWLAFAGGPWTLESGDTPGLREIVAVYLRYGAAAGAAVLVLLAVVCPWWAGRELRPGNPISTGPAPAWFRPVVFAAMAAAAVFSVPRLDFSLWDDEEHNARYSIVGRYLARDVDEPVKFRPVRWRETFFEYRDPNNHVLHSIMARLCVDAWRGVAGDAGRPFAEWPLRLPSYVFGILAVGALAWFLRVWGMPVAGALAAVLMALHPWHVRYAAECRGYAVALFLLPLLLGLWRFAIFDGRWRWWAGVGACQFAVLYAYPGTAFLLAILNLVALPVLVWTRGVAGPPRVQSGRWFCANALSAVPALVLMMPLVPQMRAYLEYESSLNKVIGAQWMWNTLTHFVAGTGWARHSAPGAEYPEVFFHLGGHAWVFHAILVLAAVLLAAGAWRFVRGDPPGWMVVAGTLVPPVMTVLFARARGHLIYESYVIFALPGVVAMVAAGAVILAERIAAGPRRAVPRAALLVLFVAGFASFTQHTRSWLRNNPLQPIKDSVLASRGTLDVARQAASPLLTASFSIPPFLYDPHAVVLESTTGLVDLLRLADERSRPLTLNIGMPWAAREYSPAMWEIANDPRLFEPPVTLRGLDPGLDRMLFRYRPGSARGVDFSDWLDRPR
jgi:hypothetical protein